VKRGTHLIIWRGGSLAPPTTNALLDEAVGNAHLGGTKAVYNDNCGELELKPPRTQEALSFNGEGVEFQQLLKDQAGFGAPLSTVREGEEESTPGTGFEEDDVTPTPPAPANASWGGGEDYKPVEDCKLLADTDQWEANNGPEEDAAAPRRLCCLGRGRHRVPERCARGSIAPQNAKDGRSLEELLRQANDAEMRGASLRAC